MKFFFLLLLLLFTQVMKNWQVILGVGRVEMFKYKYCLFLVLTLSNDVQSK